MGRPESHCYRTGPYQNPRGRSHNKGRRYIEQVWPETREQKGPVPDDIVGGVLKHCCEQLSSVFSEKINRYYLSRKPPAHPQLKAFERSPLTSPLVQSLQQRIKTHIMTYPTALWSASVHLSTWQKKNRRCHLCTFEPHLCEFGG